MSNEDGRDAALAIDSQPGTGWGVTAEAEMAKPHYLIVGLQKALTAEPGSAEGAGAPTAGTLTVTLESERGYPFVAEHPRPVPHLRDERRQPVGRRSGARERRRDRQDRAELA